MSEYLSTRELQIAELEILKKTVAVIKKHSLRYSLAGGTLLGAVRHHGFIPWDDDIDIMMPIADYNRFVECASDGMSADFFLQTYETDNYHRFYAKVRKNNTTMQEKNDSAPDSHCGVWIDIFPIIGVRNSKEWIEKQKRKMMRYKKLYYKVSCGSPWKNLSADKKILRMIPSPIKRVLLRTLYNHLFADMSKCSYCCYLWGEERIEPRFDSEMFTETSEVMFEGRGFPAPKRWDEYLTVLYGDYMTPPPEDRRSGGDHTVINIDLKHGTVKHNTSVTRGTLIG